MSDELGAAYAAHRMAERQVSKLRAELDAERATVAALRSEVATLRRLLDEAQAEVHRLESWRG